VLQGASGRVSENFTVGVLARDAAVAWADQLVYQGYDDWRLPTLGPINGSAFQTGLSNNASTDLGYAKTTTDGSDGGWRDGSGNPVSEMGYMYYVNLANLGLCTPNGAPGNCVTQSGWGLNNVSFVDGITGGTVSFDHVQRDYYWSGLEYAPYPSDAWAFSFGHGYQGNGDKGGGYYAWAVRPGDVAAAPAPGTALLMALGLWGLGAGRRVRRAT